MFGASVGLTNRDAGMALAKQVTEDLDRGLVADIGVVAARLKELGGTLTRDEQLESKQ